MPGNKSSIRGIAKMITSTMAGKPITGGTYEYYEQGPQMNSFQENAANEPVGLELDLQSLYSKDQNMDKYFVPKTTTYKGKLMTLLLACALLITIALIIMYFSEQHRAKKAGDDAKSLPELLGLTGGYSFKQVMVGMVSNFIFGFIDNAGLFFGMDALDPFIKGGPNTKAGLGNTFSDALGSFLGTFIGTSIQNYTMITDWPLYSEVIGIIIGCLFGVYIPRAITGKK